MEGCLVNKSHSPDRETQAEHLASGLENLAGLLKSKDFRNAAYKLEDDRERTIAAKDPTAYLKRNGVSLPESLHTPPLPPSAS
jgi:hypothetical protein